MPKRKYTPLAPVKTQPPINPLSRTVGAPDVQRDQCPQPTVHNIVCTSQIRSDGPIDLAALSKLLPFSFYDKQRFAAATIRLHSPQTTALIFGSGKLVITGGRDYYECVLASLCVSRILRDAFPSRSFHLIDCAIQNIVAHVCLDVGEGILDLNAMYVKLELNCMFQSSMFPGLVYRPEASPVVLLCFFSGRIVVTGGRTIRDVYEGWEKLWPVVRVFIRDTNG